MSRSELRTFCNGILKEGLTILDLKLGIVSHIEGSNYLVVAVVPDDVFKPDEVFNLTDTYCQAVVEQKKLVALTEFGDIRGLRKHPLYDGLPLESFISAPIMVDGAVWGTLNFSSMAIRDEDFSDEEVAWVNGKANLIADFVTGENMNSPG